MSGDERAVAVAGIADALVAAVAAHDGPRVQELLTDPALDVMALCVVLASHAGRSPSERYVANVLADIAAGGKIHHVARRYGMTTEGVRALVYKGPQGIGRRRPVGALLGGRWVRKGLIQVWIDDHRAAS